VRGRGGQLAGGAMVRLVLSGDEVSGHQKMVAGEVILCRYVGASGRSIGCCGAAHPVGELRLVSHALLRERRRRFVEGCAAARAARRRSAARAA
jgi:hypothetical protein